MALGATELGELGIVEEGAAGLGLGSWTQQEQSPGCSPG